MAERKQKERKEKHRREKLIITNWKTKYGLVVYIEVNYISRERFIYAQLLSAVYKMIARGKMHHHMFFFSSQNPEYSVLSIESSVSRSIAQHASEGFLVCVRASV